MQLSDLKLDSTRLYMVNVYTGKKYLIKKQRGRYYIQHSKGQLTVTSLINKPEREYDIFEDYVLSGLMESHHCHAVTFWMLKYRSMKRITPDDYKVKFGIKNNNHTEHGLI